jgi:SAM-dependent methyltransferase
MDHPTVLRRDSVLGVLAPTLGWAPPLRYLLRRHRVHHYLSRLAPGDLVEVGCGAGALLDELAHAGWHATGVDASSRARRIAAALRDASGGAQRVLAEPDAAWHQCFDVVCALDVLEHIREDEVALASWISWLRPGGHVLLSVPAHRRRWSAGDEWAGHYRRYDRTDVERLLQRCDLQVVSMECYGFPLANLTEAVGARSYRRMLQRRGDGTTREEASADSGVERSAATRLLRLLDSTPGRLGLRIALSLQAATRTTDWGSGYLVLARRP